jgi:hypothetical protein
MDKKLKGDIAEQKVILEALKQNIGVSRPIGDRLAYDMIFDVGGELHRLNLHIELIKVLVAQALNELLQIER